MLTRRKFIGSTLVAGAALTTGAQQAWPQPAATRTLVAASDGRVFVNPTGNAGLGTAGSGDTLTGVITGFVAQAFGALKDEADAFAAVVAAVYVAGHAGDLAASERGMRALVASYIRNYLSAAGRALDPEGERP